MRYLPCSTCHLPALATRAGVLHTAARISGSSVKYLCRRCGRVTILSAAEFVRLPMMTAAEIKHASCDISAADVPADYDAKLERLKQSQAKKQGK